MVRKGLVELSKLAEGRTEANESALKRLVLRDASLRDAELICLPRASSQKHSGELIPRVSPRRPVISTNCLSIEAILPSQYYSRTWLF
jgi:hypothetical protein